MAPKNRRVTWTNCSTGSCGTGSSSPYHPGPRIEVSLRGFPGQRAPFDKLVRVGLRRHHKAPGSSRPSEIGDWNRSKPAQAPATQVADLFPTSKYPGFSDLKGKIPQEYFVDNQTLTTIGKKSFRRVAKFPFSTPYIIEGCDVPLRGAPFAPRPKIVAAEVTRRIILINFD